MLDGRNGQDPHLSAVEMNINKVMREVYGTIIYWSTYLISNIKVQRKGILGRLYYQISIASCKPPFPILDLDHVIQ
jgi:hypothetical protein